MTWKVRTVGDRGHLEIVSDADTQIAAVFMNFGHADDARLIAAAPDLLAALEHIARLSSEGAISAKTQWALGDIARAAIAKATGEA